MRVDVFFVQVVEGGWRVDLRNYPAEALPPKMGYRVVEWDSRYGPCAMYGPEWVEDAIWGEALSYARRLSEIPF